MGDFDFTTKDGRVVSIAVEGTEAIAYTETGEKIGSILCREIENEYGSVLWITNMSLEGVPGYLRQGIGRECLKRLQEVSGLSLEAAEIGTGELADGSHLIQDGPGFITKMREAGIVAPSNDQLNVVRED